MDALWPAIGLVLGTIAVTLLAVLSGALVLTLLEVRGAARRLRDTLERLTPPAEETLEGLREVSRTAADATRQVKRLGGQIGPIAQWLGRHGGLLPAAAGLLGALAAYRTARRARPEGRQRGKRIVS
ncbi:MAG: hypothetical protein D6718_08295 [Acidobacteria bacterium]|nr:MAG: hypothetical protein D6718_08295 [Acidobacteriota bacterium]